MQTLDRPGAGATATTPTATSEGADGDSISPAVRVVLASLLVGAAAIHFAMVPSHANEWLAEGIAFAIVALVQIGIAAAILARPSRPVLWATCVTNLIFIAAWVVARTAGAPFGPDEGVAHDAEFVDITCVALEAVAVVVAAVALARPHVAQRLPRSAYVPLSVIPLGILVLTTAAIVSPSASDHGHAGEDPSHLASGAEATADAGHDHAIDGDGVDPASVDDKGLALLSNGEMAHEYGPDQALDATTRAALAHQLALTRLIIDRFPTLKDAKAAGSQPAGGFSPGLGLHMSTPSGMPEPPPRDPSVPSIPGTLSDAEILRPANLIYAGITDDAPLAGFMYYSVIPEEPEGFAGPNDHWHTHGSLCIKIAGKIEVLHPAELTSQACAAVGGMWIERTSYMVHVWTVPGYESNRGVFSDVNPAIACADGTYYTVAEHEQERYKLNKCRSNPA